MNRTALRYEPSGDHANPLSAGASSTSGQGTDPPADGCHVWALFPRYIVFLLVFIATHKWGLILPADGLPCAATSFLRCLPPATLLETHTTQVKRHFRCQSCPCQKQVQQIWYITTPCKAQGSQIAGMTIPGSNQSLRKVIYMLHWCLIVLVWSWSINGHCTFSTE